MATKIIYKSACLYCGCEFEFELEECYSVEKCLDGNVKIQCPNCGVVIKAKRNNLAYRTVEVEKE